MFNVKFYSDFINEEKEEDLFKNRFFFVNKKTGTRQMLTYNNDPKNKDILSFEMDLKGGLSKTSLQDAGLADNKGNFFQGLTKAILNFFGYK